MANFWATYPGGTASNGGGGGGGGAVVWAQGVPAGAINGVNTVFTVPGPIADVNTFLLIWNTRVAEPGDFTLVGTTINMTVAPGFGDSLKYYYRMT